MAAPNRIDVHQHRHQSGLDYRPERGGPAHCGHGHLVAGAQVHAAQRIGQHAESQQVGGRTGIAHHRVAGAAIGGELFLELPYLRAHGQLATEERGHAGNDFLVVIARIDQWEVQLFGCRHRLLCSKKEVCGHATW